MNPSAPDRWVDLTSVPLANKKKLADAATGEVKERIKSNIAEVERQQATRKKATRKRVANSRRRNRKR